jgi:hypothetical protein
VLAPLFAVAEVEGRQQINFQVPWSQPAPATAEVVVQTAGMNPARARVNVLAAQPGLFTPDGVRASAQHGDFRLVTATDPLERGDVVVLYGTGFGAVNDPPETGQATPSSPLSHTLAPVTMTIGGILATVQFSGLAPGLVGCYQLNVVVPMDTPSGEPPVVVTVDGVASQPVTLPVR